MKRPSFQFYPADWRKDSGLRLCSLAARGLWVELMCIAHECEEYGKLKQNGRGFSHKTLAKLVGLSPQTCLKLLTELEENGVFSKDEDGVIYSRRMVRDEELRKIRAEAGSKGGNPILVGNLVKQNAKQKPTPSSSSSSSSSEIIKKRPSLEEVVAAGNKAAYTEQECTDFWNECESRPEAPDGSWTLWNGEPMNMDRWQNALARFVSWDRQRKAKHNGNGRKQPAAANNGRKWQL